MTERLDPLAAAEVLARSAPAPGHRGGSPVRVRAVEGHDLDGRRVTMELAPGDAACLLLFLSADCHGCRDLLEAAPSELGAVDDVELVYLLRADDPPLEGCRPEVRCIVAPRAFDDYRVAGAPFFSLVDPSLEHVQTEGVAWGAASVRRAVEAARRGEPTEGHARLDPGEAT